MTTVPTFVDSADSQVVVTAQLLDSLVEAVVTSPGPRARGAIIDSLVHELCAAVGWLLQDSDTPHDDATNEVLASIGQLATAAQDHHLLVSSLRTSAAGMDTQ